MTHKKNRYEGLFVTTVFLVGLYFLYQGETSPVVLAPILPYQLLGLVP